jgi:hypothetical protein
MTFKLPELEDDGLSTPDISEWGEEKYRLVGYYATLFANSMKGKWGSRVYIDLFSGAGRARIKDTNRILPASPLLALDVKKKGSVAKIVIWVLSLSHDLSSDLIRSLHEASFLAFQVAALRNPMSSCSASVGNAATNSLIAMSKK